MLEKVIAIIGPGGSGKSTVFGNIGIQLYKYLEDLAAPKRVFGFDFDAVPCFAYDLPKMGLSILNISSDLNKFTKYKDEILETFNKEKKDNFILLNFPGDNNLDVFMEMMNEIDEIIVMTNQEKKGLVISTKLIFNIFKYRQQQEKLDKTFQKIYILCNKIGEKYAADQFGFPGKKYVDKIIFSDYEKYLQEMFLENEMSIKVRYQGIHWLDIMADVKPGQEDLTVIPLYHILRDRNVAISGIEHKPFILDYLNKEDPEKMPLSVRAIKENAKYIIANIYGYSLGKIQ